jgi:dTDP-4-dehydrorhamnose reductase
VWHSVAGKQVKIIIIGAGGRLGTALVREWRGQFDVTGFDHSQLDIGDFDQLRETLRTLRFDLLVNCAAQTDVDRCETEKEEAFRLNGEAPGVLAEICSRKDARMIHLSTDYVFDGAKGDPYSERDVAHPISVYGESKLEGERCVAAVNKRHWIVRVSWVFGPDRPSFVDAIMRRAMNETRVEAIADKRSAPTYTRDLAEWLPPIFELEEGGLLHLANAGECTWQEYAQYALDCCRDEGIELKASTVGALRLDEMKNFVARRPRYTVLSSKKYEVTTGRAPRSWRDAVAEYVRDYHPKK